MNRPVLALFASAIIALCTAFAVPVRAQTAEAPYKLTVFATAPAGLSAPDSIAVLDGHVFIGYGDGHLPDGSDGLSSQVVDFRLDGSIAHIYTVVGHNDGLKVDPLTNHLWAIQNEDANPNLVIINPKTQEQSSPFPFSATPHGGGYDDLVFRGCQIYISASNPANNPNDEPAIVSAQLEGGVVVIEPFFEGDASAVDVTTGATVTLNLQDADSMTLDPQGDIVLDSQGDDELVIIKHPGEASQQAFLVPLSFETPAGPVRVETDDTNFALARHGFILFADKGLNNVYKLTRDDFVPGTAYTAADGGPFVGTLDLSTGVVTPVVTGLSVGGPGGLVFVSSPDEDSNTEDSEATERHAQGCDRGDSR